MDHSTDYGHPIMKSKKSENLGRCGRQNMLRPYLKIWEWGLIFGRAVKAISSPGVRDTEYCFLFHYSTTKPPNIKLIIRYVIKCF